MNISYPEIGVCGLSCRLCPMYQTQAASRCLGCKSPERIAVGCQFITCAVKKKGLEFCYDCAENSTCEKWRKHREAGKLHDSFKCYQTLEADIAFMREFGVAEFEKQQKTREQLLKEILLNCDDGRSKSYYCIAATVLSATEMRSALAKAVAHSENLSPKEKAKHMHAVLDSLAREKNCALKLRK